MAFNEIKTEKIKLNPFAFFGKEWVLITAGQGEKVNTMTAAWGGLGVVWQKNVATVYIHTNRYTKEFVDQNKGFSISALPDGNIDKLTFLGKNSGRDIDKIKEVNLTTVFEDGIPYFQEANLVFICRKLFASEILPEQFVDTELREKIYPEKKYHTIYVAEIVKILKKAE